MANWLAKVRAFVTTNPTAPMDGRAEGLYAMLEYNDVPGKGTSYLDDVYNASRSFLLEKYEVQGCAVTPEALRDIMQQGIRAYAEAVHANNADNGLQTWDQISAGTDLSKTAKEAQPFIN